MKGLRQTMHKRNNLDCVIIHVGANDLNSETTPKRIAKSIVDVAKKNKTESRSASISRIVPRCKNLKNMALEVSQERSKMCKEAKFY